MGEGEVSGWGGGAWWGWGRVEGVVTPAGDSCVNPCVTSRSTWTDGGAYETCGTVAKGWGLRAGDWGLVGPGTWRGPRGAKEGRSYKEDAVRENQLISGIKLRQQRQVHQWRWLQQGRRPVAGVSEERNT